MKYPGKVACICGVILCILMIGPRVVSASGFEGSLGLSVSQRFFSDEKLANVNGFSNWGALEFDLTVGVYEFSFGLEPLLGFGFIMNSASLYALDDNGEYILDDEGRRIESSVDSLEYQLYTLSVGARYKPWTSRFFLLIPYGEFLANVRFGSVEKKTYAVGQQKISRGADLGLTLGGGLLISLFYDQERRGDMEMLWNLKDFFLVASARYLPSGFGKQGLGVISDTGGWSFGAGLLLDW